MEVPKAWKRSRGFMLGAVIGALIITCAGAIWGLITLVNQASVRPWHFVLLLIPAVLLLAACIRQLVAITKMPATSSSSADAVENSNYGRHVGIWFAAIFGIEIGLIALAAALLANAGRPLLIPVAMVAIIGAHFVPLAKLFGVPTYAVMGVALVVAAGISLLIPDEPTRLFVLGIATTIFLWMGAASVLANHTRPSNAPHTG